MGQTFEYLKMALQNIRANKGRSLLTMLGIVWNFFSCVSVEQAKIEYVTGLHCTEGRVCI